MSELTHDSIDDGFHEIQLSGKQLVALFLVTTTVIVVVFLCGVRVGRGARVEADEPEPSVATPTAAAQPAPVVAPPAEPPAPVADSQDDKLSYPKLLEGDGTPSAKLEKKKADEPKTEAASPAKASGPPPAKAAVALPAPVAPPTATSGSSAPSSTDNLPTSGRPGTWVVQVIATRERSIAVSVLKRLEAKAYPVYLVSPSAGATPAYYKVHVGRYNDRGEAEKVSTRIKKEEQFQSWITR